MKANFLMIFMETRKTLRKKSRIMLKLYHIKEQNLGYWGLGGDFF